MNCNSSPEFVEDMRYISESVVSQASIRHNVLNGRFYALCRLTTAGVWNTAAAGSEIRKASSPEFVLGFREKGKRKGHCKLIAPQSFPEG